MTSDLISVVVVDDDFRVAKIHSSFVSRVVGFEVVGLAHTAAQARPLMTELRPDLILLDLYLPDVFGLEFLNRLRVDGVHSDAIVITAANESETVQRALQVGVSNYLLKPFTFADLESRLIDYRAQRRQRPGRRIGDQSEIDRLFGRPETKHDLQLPKGLSPETASLITDAVANAATDLSARECAERVGVSRVSARRYLEFFASAGLLKVNLRYGSAGRPERRYAWLAGHRHYPPDPQHH